jgi:hypothetical protein
MEIPEPPTIDNPIDVGNKCNDCGNNLGLYTLFERCKYCRRIEHRNGKTIKAILYKESFNGIYQTSCGVSMESNHSENREYTFNAKMGKSFAEKIGIDNNSPTNSEGFRRIPNSIISIGENDVKINKHGISLEHDKVSEKDIEQFFVSIPSFPIFRIIYE